MDALEFLKERRRLCSCYEECIDCPLKGVKCNINNFVTDEHYSKIIAAVEQWSKEHPCKTRQSVFLEQYPNCMMGDDDVVGTCPRHVDKNYICDLSRFGRCSDCRREFWLQEVE